MRFNSMHVSILAVLLSFEASAQIVTEEYRPNGKQQEFENSLYCIDYFAEEQKKDKPRGETMLKDIKGGVYQRAAQHGGIYHLRKLLTVSRSLSESQVKETSVNATNVLGKLQGKYESSMVQLDCELSLLNAKILGLEYFKTEQLSPEVLKIHKNTQSFSYKL
jgi:hypothetical protein